jgi:tyrosinase
MCSRIRRSDTRWRRSRRTWPKGSFVVNLLANGEPIAKRAFFQPQSPRDCDTCRTHPLINLDFRIDQEKILDRKLSVTIEVPTHEEMGTEFPLSQAGNPSINARLLLDDG